MFSPKLHRLSISRSRYFSDAFNGTLANWTVVDEGPNERPYRWVISNGQLLQQSNTGGGSPAGSDPVKPGTYFMPGNPNWTDYSFGVSLMSQDNDAIGVMFRYRDGQNYYRFAMDQAEFLPQVDQRPSAV